MKLLIKLVVSMIIIVSLSCNHNLDKKGIDLDIAIAPQLLTDYLFIKMNYKYALTNSYKSLSSDYKVFVHFWRVKTKDMLIQDDHSPEPSMELWKTNQNFSYSRTIFLPKFIDEFDSGFTGDEPIKLTIGLHNPKIANSKIILFQKMLNIKSVSFNSPQISYDEGWYSPETNANIADSEERKWRWTSKQAVCVIENPKKNSTLKIHGYVKLLEQKVIFKINDLIIDEFVPGNIKFQKEYLLTADQLGTEEEFVLTIETDKIFVPSLLEPPAKDSRELGVQIFFLYFREAIS
jgi:hypothetical protein